MNTTGLVDRYIAAWNESDSERRQELIARTWTDDASYVDPMMQAQGREAIDAMIQSVQGQFSHCRFRRTSEVDTHNNRVRFAWELGPEGAPALAGGVDFGIIASERLQSITGFLDYAPLPARQ